MRSKGDYPALPARRSPGGLNRLPRPSSFEPALRPLEREPEVLPEIELSSRGISMRDFLNVVFRHKKKIMAMWTLCVVLTLGVVVVVKDSYVSEAKVLIRSDRTNVVIDPSGEGKSFLKGSALPTVQIRAEMAIISSTALAEQVVDAIGPERILEPEQPSEPGTDSGPSVGPMADSVEWIKELGIKEMMLAGLAKLNLRPSNLTPREKAIKETMKALHVAPSSSDALSDSNVLDLSYKSHSPEVATEVLDTLLRLYREKHIKVHHPLISAELFESKSEELKQQLHDEEENLDELRRELNVASLKKQKDMLLVRFDNLRSKSADTSASLRSSGALIAELQDQFNREPEADEFAGALRTADPLTQQMSNRLVTLILKKIELERKYQPGTKPIESVTKEIGEVEQMLARTEEVFPADALTVDPIKKNLAIQIESEKVKVAGEKALHETLETQMASVNKELTTLTSYEMEFERRDREVEILTNAYLQHLNSAQRAEISAELDRRKISNVSIVQAATHPIGSLKSARRMIGLLLVGIIAGFCISIVMAFVVEYLDHSLKTIEEVEQALGLPVLVALPMIKNPQPEIAKEIA